MLITIIAAIIAGGCFAAAGVLQQRVASTRPENESLTPKLILDLLRQPVWLAGIGMAILSYGFQSVALAYGTLAVVQPLIVTELIFALPISVRLHNMRLGKREWLGALAVAGGLAVGIVSSQPRGGNPLPSTLMWMITLGAVVLLAVVALVIARRTEGTPRASLFALAGATIMGFQSSLLAATIKLLGTDGWGVFAHWQPYLMIIASIVGLLMLQSAYQAGPLAASMPVIDATEPIVAIAIGIAVFGEVINTGVLNLIGTGIGLVALFTGIVVLDLSPLVQRVQAEEAEERDETDGESLAFGDIMHHDGHGGGHGDEHVDAKAGEKAAEPTA